MPNNFFVFGMPKCGKTTLLKRLADELKGKGYMVGGFLSPEVKEHGTREGFYVEDIETGKKAVLAGVDIDGPKVSKYHVGVRSFETIALPVLQRAREYDVIIIDEIGRMELKSTAFENALKDALDGGKPVVVASLHRDYVESYNGYGTLIELMMTNREAVYERLLKEVLVALKK